MLQRSFSYDAPMKLKTVGPSEAIRSLEGQGYGSNVSAHPKASESYNQQQRIATVFSKPPQKQLEFQKAVDESPFIPSPELVKLVRQSIIEPDKKILKDDIVKEIITGELEGMLTSLVSRNPDKDKKIKITENSAFTNEIELELKERLDIDEKKADTVIPQLYNEFSSFISKRPRKRLWGNIILENSMILLIPDYSTLSYIRTDS